MKTKKNKTQKINCCINAYDFDCFDGDDINLPPKQTFKLFIDYPLHNKAQFDLNTGNGMGFLGIIKQISKAYKKVYSAPGKYGIWGHCIEDLVVEAIYVDYDKKEIKLSMGS